MIRAAWQRFGTGRDIASRRAALDEEFEDEWADHLSRVERELMLRGVSPEEAARQAAVRMGDREAIRRRCHRVVLGSSIMLQRLNVVLLAVISAAAVFLSFELQRGRAEQRRDIDDLRQTLMAALHVPPGAGAPAMAMMQPPQQEVRERPAARAAAGADWPVTTPQASGLDAEVIEAHRALCETTGADSCLVIWRGAIVSEWYAPSWTGFSYFMSSTKSITALLVGMLIADDKIASADEPVSKWIPAWKAGAQAGVTIRNLLSHTSGLDKRLQDSVGFVSDKNAFVLALPLDRAPGERFSYSNEGVQLLSPLLDRAAGEPIQDYARRRLFEPLGLGRTRLHLDERRHAWTYADMESTPREFARLGQLVLQKGKWRGEQLIPESWIDEITRVSQPFEESCGLLWWLVEEPKGFATLGYLDTNMYLFPSHDLIVVRTQAKPAATKAQYQPGALALFKKLLEAPSAPPAAAQARAWLDEATALNRTGEWERAFEVAERIVRDPRATGALRVEAALSMAHAATCLRRADAAEETLAGIERSALAGDPSLASFHGQVMELFRETFEREPVGR